MSAAKTAAHVAKTDTKPKEDAAVIGQRALKAQALAVKYQAQIGARLSTTFLTAFAADITSLPGVAPAVEVAKSGSVQLTAAQTVAVAKGHRLVKGIRATVKSYKPTKEVLLAYGIGSESKAQSVGGTIADITGLLTRIAANPSEAAGYDIVAADITALTSARAAIQSAESVQEATRASTPQQTKARNATLRRLLAGIKKIAGAGMRTFSDAADATTYASFEAL